MTYQWVETYTYDLPSFTAPTQVAIIVEVNGSTGATITVEARAGTTGEWISAMPPGVTNLLGILFYLDIRRGIEYRLRSSAEVNTHPVQILPN